MSYINDNFLLSNKTANELYFNYAKDMPIFDYHCHLSEYQILENKQFEDIYEIWLKGDHYKWRLMRNYGIDEEYITGSKSNKEKFLVYCKVLSTAFGNPLYHWSQIELRDYFNCNLEINEENAPKIWDECNKYIKENEITPVKLIEESKVTHLFTTNEIFDNLEVFDCIKEKNYKFRVFPAFRADKIMNIDASNYNSYVDKLGNIKDIDELENAIENRLQSFISKGCVAADIALEAVYNVPTKKEANKVFVDRRNNKELSINEVKIFKGYLTYYLLKLYAKYNIVTELHIGAMRNNNTKMLNKLGLDTGFDSISSENSIKELSCLFDKLNNENLLPKIILFNLNPKMNSEMLTLLGCFQDSSAKGKIQYGASWWFLDHKNGIKKHLDDLTSLGHIDSFIGMLTDSRSFLSYSRHHYFRRILCDYLGNLVENNEITNNIKLVGEVIKNISYYNAINYFKIVV